MKHSKVYEVCGGDAYSKCTVCNVYLHVNSAKGKHAGKTCFHDYHDTCMFGLVQSDNHIGNFKKKEWAFPSAAKAKENMKMLSSLSEDV